jgi:hypothetical protein
MTKVKIEAGHRPMDRFGRVPARHLLSARERRWTLCVAATNDPAQDRIGEPGCQWLTVGQQCRFRQNGLEARQAVTFVRSVYVSGALSCHIGEDLIKVDLSLRCWCGGKRLKVRLHHARTDADANGDCD